MVVRITARRLSVAAAYAALPDPASGGVVVFVGRSRAEPGPGGPVAALDYEADVPMAMAILRRLEAEAAKRFATHRTLVWHRIGRVPIGEPSVIIGVAAPHRAEAFEAARFLIDALKVEAPIWKSARSRPGRPRPGRRSPTRRRSTG